MSRAMQMEKLTSSQKNISKVSALNLNREKQVTQTKETMMYSNLSDTTKKAIGAVRASGGDVTRFAIDLASQIDKGNITTEQAVRMVAAKHAK